MRLPQRSALQRLGEDRLSQGNDNLKINQVRVQLSSALAKVASKVAQVADLEATLAHTQDDREASEALVKTFAEKLEIAAAEKKELKEELAALENTVCELEDRLDEALDDFVERLSSEEARAGRRCVRLPLLIPATRAHDQASRQASYTEPDPRLSSQFKV